MQHQSEKGSTAHYTDQKDYGGVPHQGNGRGQLSLVSARVGARAPVGVGNKTQALQTPVRNLG